MNLSLVDQSSKTWSYPVAYRLLLHFIMLQESQDSISGFITTEITLSSLLSAAVIDL